jgi:hypothetical protein
MNIAVVGIDLAKNVFQLCTLGANGSVVGNHKVTRSKFRAILADLSKSALITAEACLATPLSNRTRCCRLMEAADELTECLHL